MNSSMQHGEPAKKRFIIASVCNIEHSLDKTRLLLCDSKNRQITASTPLMGNENLHYDNKLLLLEGAWSEIPWEEDHFCIQEIYSSSQLQLRSATSEHPNIALLITWLEKLQPILRAFITEIIESDLGVKLLQLPASQSHHHNYRGGLLAHSIECAIIAGQLALPALPKVEAELTMVAAFLHDIGKCGTHSELGNYIHLGNFISHDAYTLEALAPFLSTLDKNWPLGASLLRNMLTKEKSYSFPTFPGKLLVQLADQFSTALDQRRTVFADHPPGHYFAHDKKHQQKYLRIPL